MSGIGRGARVRAVRTTALAFVLATAVALLLPAPGLAVSPPITGLRVIDGEGWHSQNGFAVEWDPVHHGSQDVRYTVTYADGSPIPEFRVWETSQSLVKEIYVPPVPGVYIFEAWNHYYPQERSPGEESPIARVALRLDDSRPQPVADETPPWIAAGSRTYTVRLSHPAAPLPPSGILGYAVSIDQDPGGIPCAGADRCAPAEVDLAGGIANDTLELPILPEGISYVHAVAVSGSGMTSSAVGTTRLSVDGTPPSVNLQGLPTGWASGAVQVTAVANDPLSGVAGTGPGGPFTAIAVDGAAPRIVPGATATTTIAGEGVHQLAYYGRDAVGNTGDGSLPFAHPGAATVRIDETGPIVRFAAGDPSDPERIEATVADALSGVDPDRGLIEIRPVGHGPFRPLPTDASRGRLVARWNSDDFPHGDYELRATGYDAAGNATSSTAGPSGSPLVLHDPVKRETRLAFGFGAGQLVYQRCSRSDGARRCRRTVVRPYAKRPAARTLPCCHAAVVGGRLVDASGEPLAGQTVEVVETLGRGARNGSRRTELVTDDDGRFTTRIVPGPSRTVTAAFPGTRRLTRALGRDLRLRVRAGVRLHVSTSHVKVGGAPVVFSGQIAHPEARLPASGLPVELEFRVPGTAWAQFRTVQSDASGRFRYPYEFSDDDSAGVRFQFRAFVPAAGNWPFAPARSRPLAVTG